MFCSLWSSYNIHEQVHLICVIRFCKQQKNASVCTQSSLIKWSAYCSKNSMEESLNNSDHYSGSIVRVRVKII